MAGTRMAAWPVELNGLRLAILRLRRGWQKMLTPDKTSDYWLLYNKK